jgi:hypothetical protein
LIIRLVLVVGPARLRPSTIGCGLALCGWTLQLPVGAGVRQLWSCAVIRR